MANDEWMTPNTLDHPIIDLVLDTFGGVIDLDPCCSKYTFHNVPAHKHFNDSLRYKWKGNVYVNPPFSNILPFIIHGIKHYNKGNINQIIYLIKSGALQNKKSGALLTQADAICLWGCGKSSRIAFLDEYNNPVKGADFDCALVYFGEDIGRFIYNFSGYGNVYQKMI